MKRKKSTVLSVFCCALLVIAASLTGCGIDEFDFTETSDEVVVNGDPTGGLLSDSLLNPFQFNINLDRELEKRDASGAQAVYLTALELEITQTEMGEDDTDNFNFLEQMTVYANSDNEPQRQIAQITDVPQDQQRISLETDEDVNLKPYIEDGLRLHTEVEGELPEDDTSMLARTTLTVDVL